MSFPEKLYHTLKSTSIQINIGHPLSNYACIEMVYIPYLGIAEMPGVYYCGNLHVPGIAANYLVSFDPILKMKETFLTSHVPTPWPGFMSLAAPTFLY